MAFSAQHAELLETTAKEMFFKQFSMRPVIFRQILRVRSSTKAFEDGMRVQGVGTLALKREGTPITYTDPISGARVRAFHSTYGRGCRFTEEMWDDDQWEIMNQMPADLGDSARDHQETLAHAPINGAFVSTTYSTLDGQPLISTAHTNLDSTATFSNRLSPDLALSVTGLRAVTVLAVQTKSEEDRFVSIRQKTLLVPPDLMHTAQELLESQFDPETSTNAVNTVAMSRSGLSPVTSPYLTSSTAWYVIGDMHSMTWYDRKPITPDSGTDSHTKDFLFDIRYRALVRDLDWRGWWGSNP